MHNRNFEHTPACRESPRYCICHVQNRQGWASTEPSIITMDNIKLDPLTAGLFKTPIAQEFGPNPTPAEVYAWENSRHLPRLANRTGDEWKRIVTERNDAISDARSWRRWAMVATTILVAVVTAGCLGLIR